MPACRDTGARPSAVDFARRVRRILAAVPPGRVVTYGQVAALAGHPRHARRVGRFLAELPPGHGLPWHRVLNAQGRVSPRGEGVGAADVVTRQQRLLEAEGVAFRNGRVDLRRYRWRAEEAGGWLAALDDADEPAGERTDNAAPPGRDG